LSEDREQDRTRGRKDASRPVTAAARRERRASARAGASAEGATAKSSSASASTRQQRAAGSGAAKASTEKKGRPTPSREREERRPSVFARLARFLREVVAELRKVIWPTRKQLITYTSVVLVFVAFMVAFVFGLDVVFREAIFWVFA
jgi:preprotein translocase subunit SecE